MTLTRYLFIVLDPRFGKAFEQQIHPILQKPLKYTVLRINFCMVAWRQNSYRHTPRYVLGL